MLLVAGPGDKTQLLTKETEGEGSSWAILGCI